MKRPFRICLTELRLHFCLRSVVGSLALSSSLALSFCLALAFACAARASTPAPLFDVPPPASATDEVLLISTRAVGTDCHSDKMNRELRCHRFNRRSQWEQANWRQLFASHEAIPTIVYVHGNRVAPGRDRAEGLRVYQSFKKHRRTIGPVRFVIWSWPSSKIPGPIKDYLVKAQRTNPVAWQLAWWLDQLPSETPISLFGYSYGTRVVSGAAHLLAGGRLGELRLASRKHPERPPVRAVLLAAAYDADWIQPGRFYSHALGQVERLVLATNELDPAMRFYHLSNGRGRMHALGKSGVYQVQSLGSAARQLGRVDFTREVGRSHSLVDYLAAQAKMDTVWQQLLAGRQSALANSTVRQRANAYASH